MDFSQNYFELFNLPESQRVDHAELSARWQQLQRTCHPDNHAASTAAEQRYAMQMASLVNEAYETLRVPLARAVYLMQLRGVDLDAETDTRMAPEFLMLQMSLREEIDAIKVAGRSRAGSPDTDAAAGQDDLESRIDSLFNQVERQEADIEQRFSAALTSDDLAMARELARQWQFTHKLTREIRQLENELDL